MVDTAATNMASLNDCFPRVRDFLDHLFSDDWSKLLLLRVAYQTVANSRPDSTARLHDGVPPDCRAGRPPLPGELQAEHR